MKLKRRLLVGAFVAIQLYGLFAGIKVRVSEGYEMWNLKECTTGSFSHYAEWITVPGRFVGCVIATKRP